MKPYNTIKKLIEINGTKQSVTFSFYCEHDDLTLDDVIGDAENKEELERKINNGSLDICFIQVKASLGYFDGIESIGGCYVSCPKDVDDILSQYELEKGALNDLIETMKLQHAQLNKIFKGA